MNEAGGQISTVGITSESNLATTCQLFIYGIDCNNTLFRHKHQGMRFPVFAPEPSKLLQKLRNLPNDAQTSQMITEFENLQKQSTERYVKQWYNITIASTK